MSEPTCSRSVRVNQLARCSKGFLCHHAVVATFKLTADGVPGTVALKRTRGEALPPGLLRCIKGALEGEPMALPQGLLGAVMVSYPLHYSCAGGD